MRLEEGSALPLSYTVLVVLASSFSLPEYTIAVLGTQLVSIMLRTGERSRTWRLEIFAVRITVAVATYRRVPRRVACSSATRAGRAGARCARGRRGGATAGRRRRSTLLRLGASFAARGRLAWLAIASSGMLMAIGYRASTVTAAWASGDRCSSPRRCSPPGMRSSGWTMRHARTARRSRPWRWRPSSEDWCPPVTPSGVATLATAMGEQLGLSAPDVRDLEMAALLHHLGQVTLDLPVDERGADPGEVSPVTGAMFREIRPLVAAGEIIAGDVDDPKRRLAVQALRLASEYDDLTAHDQVPEELAVESLALGALLRLRGAGRRRAGTRVRDRVSAGS